MESIDYVAYLPSRHLDDFHLAGFAYYDGIDVIDQLTVGTPVTLVREVGNSFDANAIAIYYQHYKLGYIPKTHNAIFSKLLFYGYNDMLEAHIQCKCTDSHPEHQIRVVVRLKDNRKTK